MRGNKSGASRAQTVTVTVVEKIHYNITVKVWTKDMVQVVFFVGLRRSRARVGTGGVESDDRGITRAIRGPRALKVSTPLWGGIRVRYPRRPTKTYGTPFDAPSDGGRDGVAQEFLAAR